MVAIGTPVTVNAALANASAAVLTHVWATPVNGSTARPLNAMP
jgi:hypothetical protein